MRRIRTQLMSLSDIELAALASALLAAIETFTDDDLSVEEEAIERAYECVLTAGEYRIGIDEFVALRDAA